MNVGDLKRLLSKADDEDEVRIVVQKLQLGATPSVGIDHARIGIDWDRDKVLLVPMENLVKNASESNE
jgi:hypothetical protein